MTRLADVNHLPRPGDGGEDLRAFSGDPLVLDLDWPDDVVEQFLFDHGAKGEFTEQYGHLALETLTWTLDELPADEFARVTWTVEHLGGRVEECEREWVRHVAQRPADEQARWQESGTWITPPLLIDASLLAPPASGLHLVEGHTRIGILRGRLAARVAQPDQAHSVYVCRAR